MGNSIINKRCSCKYLFKPTLDDETKNDEEAQLALGDYLIDHDLHPSMVIHRGHSYYLNSTLDKLDTSGKLVLLGSCGGYQSLSKVLKNCPVAQIISSRQTGSGTINGPMINIIVEQLRQGKNLDWQVLWKVIGNRFHTKNILMIMFLLIKISVLYL